MTTKPRNLGWLLLPVALSGCANVAEKLRSQPVAHYPVGDSTGYVGEIGKSEAKIRFFCMEASGDSDGAKDSRGQAAQSCSYASAAYTDIVNFKSSDPAEVDRALDSLVSMSDLNCSNYMHRVFSNRALTDFSGTLSEDLLTSAATATAHIEPTAAAALGVANLVVGKSMDAFHSTYFLDKTFQALEAAINGERQRILATIIAKRAKAKATPAAFAYGPVEALSDLRAYDDACSFKAGLNVLVSLAEKEKEARSLEVARLEIAPDTLVEARRQLEARGSEAQRGAAPDMQAGQEAGDPGRR